MKMFKRITALCLALVLSICLFGCSSEPEISLADSLAKGQELMNPAGETGRQFELTIEQGSNYKYLISGVMKDGKMIASVVVAHNGMKSTYKNLFLVDGNHFSINMNAALTALEIEQSFEFAESDALQGKYLHLENGYKMLTEYQNYLHSLNKTYIDGLRGATENTGRGGYEFTYTAEALKPVLVDMTNALTTSKDANIAKVQGYITALCSSNIDDYQRAMAYLQDCIDIDTDEVLKEHEQSSTHVYNLLAQELKALTNLLTAEGSYVRETIGYSEAEGASFTHEICMNDKNDKQIARIHLTVSTNNEVATINPSECTYVQMKEFLPLLLTNAKIHKGVGYETSDFPYEVTYTQSAITLVEQHDTYRAVHFFDFTNGRLNKYTVTFETYDYNMHNALTYKYQQLNYQVATNNSSALSAGVGAGVLEVYSEGLPAEYNTGSIIQLLDSIKQIGVPTYAPIE